MDTVPDLGWWVIHGDSLLDVLHRARAGEDPDMLIAELYANSDSEDADDEF
jgi:hypothetical protein